MDGIKKVSGGLDSAQDYLTQLQNSPDSDLAGWYVPEEALNNKDFKKVFDTYLSKDRKTMTLDVIFAENPYGTEAIDRVPDIEAAVHRAVQGSALEKADVAVGGVTSTFADLQTMSNKDYTYRYADAGRDFYHSGDPASIRHHADLSHYFSCLRTSHRWHLQKWSL